MRAADYLASFRKGDGRYDSWLYDQVRALPEEERFVFVKEMLTLRPHAGMMFVRRCINTPIHLDAIFREGLAQVREVSSVKFWLELMIPKRGARRTLATLDQLLLEYPVAVASSLYHLGWHLRDFQPSELAAYVALAERAQQELPAKWQPWVPTAEVLDKLRAKLVAPV